MNLTNQTCQTCDHFISDEKLCAFYPARIQVSDSHFCGQWENSTSPKYFSAPTKLKAEELYHWLINDSNPDETKGQKIAAASSRFDVSTRTVEERLKQLNRMGYVRFHRNGKDYFVNPTLNSDETGFREWEEDGPKGDDGEEVHAEANYRRKWDFSHIKPAFATPDEILSFNQIAKVSPPMGRASFTRIIKDALTSGQITKTPDGKYKLV